MIPYPRTGKRVFAPRTGKRSPSIWKRVFAPRTGKRAAFGPRTGKRARAFGPRIGKRDSSYAGVGEIPEDFFQLKNSLESLDINSPEYLQNLQDFKNEHLESPSDQENSSRDLD